MRIKGATNELVVFNRKLREAYTFNSNDVREAVKTLFVLHGYNATEIGIMFGVTRERIRQLLKREGFSTSHGIHNSLPRLWDETASRFRPMTPGEFRVQQRIAGIKSRKQKRDTRIAEQRAQHISVFRNLAPCGSLAPKLRELAEVLGKDVSGSSEWGGWILRAWKDSPGRTWKHGEGTEAYHRLCAAFGWVPRSPGRPVD